MPINLLRLRHLSTPTPTHPFDAGVPIMKPFLFGISAALLAAIPVSGQAKTPAQCNAEYESNKTAIRASGESKRVFVTRCRSDTQATTAPLSPKDPSAAATPSGRAARAIGNPTKTNEFASEAEAKAHCPGDTVVWANTRTHIYHSAGSNAYGNTKKGAYLCERDAGSLGIRAAKKRTPPT
jgi:hypothetical protein